MVFGKSILITGGLGYIGSHLCMRFLEMGYNVYTVDNFSNSHRDVYYTLKKIYPDEKKFKFYEGDFTSETLMEHIFGFNEIDLVIHAGALKSVRDSIDNPELYYEKNISSTNLLVKMMKKYNVENIIFASSASVYDPNNNGPIDIGSPLKPDTPYGDTKMIGEMLLKRFSECRNVKCFIMRFFNPVGTNGILREEPKIASNLFPAIINTEETFEIFGSDYPTKDGTCERDFIHIDDLTDLIALAANKIFDSKVALFEIFNVGRGKSISVLEVVKCMQKYKKFDYKISERKKGDTPITLSDISKTKSYFGWEPKRTLDDMCRSSI